METLKLPGITLQGYSQGGIQSSIAVREVGAIFDAGVVLPVALRYKKIFITHGHPDHIGAITNIAARRALMDLDAVDVYVPKSVKQPLDGIFALWSEINGGKKAKFPVEIHPVEIGDVIQPQKDLSFSAVRSYHSIDSNGWSVTRTTRKLKSEYEDLSSNELVALKRQGVDVTQPKQLNIFTISGDTTIEFLLNEKQAQTAKVLVHEVTIWSDKVSDVEKTRHYGHTHYRDMIEHCEKFSGDHLVLCHRSLKHSRKEIEGIVATQFPASMRDKIHLFDGAHR